MLREIYDLAILGPTSGNRLPSRFVFVRGERAKRRLLPLIAPGNQHKVATAPVTVVIGYDLNFYVHLHRLHAHRDNSDDYRQSPSLAEQTAFRNGSLQGAYLMIAARALGLDCGPLSGFDQEGVNEMFFKGTAVRSNFLCCLGYGDPEYLFPRHPRFDFDEICELV